MRSLLPLVGLLILQPLFADKITLKNGETFEGDFFGATSQEIRFVVDGKLMNFKTTAVATIHFGDAVAPVPAAAPVPEPAAKTPPAPRTAAPPAKAAPPREAARSAETRSTSDRPSIRRRPTGTTTTAPTVETTSRPSPDETSETVDPAESDGILVPRWTPLLVRLNEIVDPRIHRDGSTVDGQLTSPVVVNGQTVFPKGTHVVARLIDKYGRTQREDRDQRGDETVTLELTEILHAGERIPIRTDEVRHYVRGSRSQRAAESLGNIGRELGTILGGTVGRQTGQRLPPGTTGTPSPSPGESTRVPGGAVGAGGVLQFSLMSEIHRRPTSPPSDEFTE